VNTTLISRNEGFTPEQLCGKKNQFKASFIIFFSAPRRRGENMFEYFSFDNANIFLVLKSLKMIKELCKTQKKPQTNKMTKKHLQNIYFCIQGAVNRVYILIFL
jgi:hypothetical protein